MYFGSVFEFVEVWWCFFRVWGRKKKWFEGIRESVRARVDSWCGCGKGGKSKWGKGFERDAL